MSISNIKSKISHFLLYVYFVFPVVVSAQSRTAKTPNTFKDFACNVVKIFLDFVPFIFGITAVLFIWGIVKYVSSGDNEEKRSSAVKLMVFGIIGLFVMVAVWGILKIVVSSFGFSFGIPQFNSTGGGFRGSCAS